MTIEAENLDERLPAKAPKPGEIFADKYRIERVLGVGGMGYVLAATHVHLDERVAIKMLLPELAQHADIAQRFLREGRAAVKIRSEHVGRVLDVAIADGTAYMVMEYLDGCDLSQLIEQRGRLPVVVAVDYVLQACEAVAEAHAMGTVHRDLKPANLFLVRRPDGRDVIKVLDFGISKMAPTDARPELAMTKTSASMGSPLYMSPEQLISSKMVDSRADIWALGVILFDLVAGRPPFLADSLAALGALVLSGSAPDLRTFVPDAPPGVAGAVATCLRRDPGERFPSCAELAAALAPFGTPAAHASARVIGQVLANTPRVAGSWPHVGGLGEPPADRGVSSAASTLELATGSPPPMPAPSQIAGTWGSTSPPVAPPPTRGAAILARAAAAVASVVVLALLVIVGMRVANSAKTTALPPATGASPAGVPSTPALPIAASVVAPAEASSPTTPSSPSGQDASPVSALNADRAVSAPMATMRPRATPAPSASVSGRSAPSCNPPFNINANGDKVFKKECL